MNRDQYDAKQVWYDHKTATGTTANSDVAQKQGDTALSGGAASPTVRGGNTTCGVIVPLPVTQPRSAANTPSIERIAM